MIVGRFILNAVLYKQVHYTYFTLTYVVAFILLVVLDHLWVAILAIIGVTAFIVAVAFLAVWCYSTRRRGRSGNLTLSSTYKVYHT